MAASKEVFQHKGLSAPDATTHEVFAHEQLSAPEGDTSDAACTIFSIQGVSGVGVAGCAIAGLDYGRRE